MEIKEQIAEELKKYIDKFDKYDQELPKLVDKKEKNYQERKKEFDEKWDEDIFPTDIPIRDKEKKQLETMHSNLQRLKKNLNDEIKENESQLKTSIIEWKDLINTRRNELVGYVNNKNQYLVEKNKLEEELKKQVDGIKIWEKNGINPNDAIYLKRKNEIIPNLENQIKVINSKLDEKKIREEYKKLGDLKNKIMAVELHDRKHILPELADIFEINKIKPEPTKPEPVKPEPVKPEPVKPEPVKPEPVKPEPVKTGPVKPEPAKTEPVKPEPVKSEPVKPEPAKTEPAKTEPVKPEPTRSDSIKINSNEQENQPFVKLIIGRKIKIRYADGKTIPIINTKEYFKYLKKSNDPESRINSQLLNRINIEKEGEDLSIDSVDSIIKFSMLHALKNDLVLKEDIKKAIQAIEIRDKKKLDSIFPIAIDKRDLSKRAFLPWNRKKRDIINRVADENADLIECIGEYEPNPLKRIFKSTKKLLSANPRQEMITDGSERQNDEEIEKQKLSEREDIKVSQAYIKLADAIGDIQNESNERLWYEAVKEQIEKGNLSDREAEGLKLVYQERLKTIRDDKIKEPTKDNNKDDQESEK